MHRVLSAATREAPLPGGPAPGTGPPRALARRAALPGSRRSSPPGDRAPGRPSSSRRGRVAARGLLPNGTRAVECRHRAGLALSPACPAPSANEAARHHDLVSPRFEKAPERKQAPLPIGLRLVPVDRRHCKCGRSSPAGRERPTLVERALYGPTLREETPQAAAAASTRAPQTKPSSSDPSPFRHRRGLTTRAAALQKNSC